MQKSHSFLHHQISARSLELPLILVASALWPTVASAETIKAANDSTGTVVTQVDNQYTIEQGSFSADGINQFHSLESFSVESGAFAHFATPDDVQNVLTKVSGTTPSVINGSVQVTGAQQPNLYLMNPAGVLIGPEANMNLPGSLTVTTADGVGFEDGWFSAVEENAYKNLTGTPTGDFVFSGSQSGAIVNEGSLSLAADAALTLLGGTVANTGDIDVPGGEIVLAAVPGESLVKLRSPNSLLTLEISPKELNSQTTENSFLNSLNPLELPALLAYSEQSTATQLITHADGTVSLTSGSESIESGDVASTGMLSAASDEGIGGRVVLLGDRTHLFNANIAASGQNGGGTIHVGGDYRGGDALPTATTTWIDRSTKISADALGTGDGGQVSIWADDNTQYLGSITARGGAIAGDGGAVEVSGKQTLFFDGVVDTSAPHGEMGSLLLDPENIVIVNGSGGTDDAQIIDNTIFAGESAAQFTLSERTLSRLAANATLTLEAKNNITVEPLFDQALSFRPGNGAITLKADADGDGSGDFIVTDPETTLIAPGRDLSISGANLLLGDLNTAAMFQGGNINLNASGTVTTGNIDTHTLQTVSQSGNINVTAASITTRDIFTQSLGRSGDVTLIGTLGSIATGEIFTDSLSGSDGDVALSAPNSILVAGTVIQEPPLALTGSTAPAVASSLEASDSSGTSDNGNVDVLEALASLGVEALGLGATNQGGGTGALGTGAGLLASGGGDSALSEDSDGDGSSQSTVLSTAEANAAIANLEGEQTQQFTGYFGRELATKEQDLEDIQQMLSEIARESGTHSAVVYVKAPSKSTDSGETTEESTEQKPTETLELLLITADRPSIKIEVPNLPRETLVETVATFRTDLLTSVRRGGTQYLAAAQQLHQWLVAPVEEALASAEGVDIDTLAFSMDTGLRTLPLSALHDGEQFLVEKYSLGLLPSLGLVNTQYNSLADAEVTAMGASQFEQLEPLPAVPIEIERIQSLWSGSAFLNEDFTQQNLIQQQAQSPANIIHLATHAEFNAGSIDSSYIQLWDGPLRLNEIKQLGWQASDVNLLVLSACRTAVGSMEAELGFAGIALASGARTAMASLWSVDDVGTLALMSELYGQLGKVPTKVEALRAAQLAMINGELQPASRQLLNDVDKNIPALTSALGTIKENNLSHPYYWSGFVMVGSPW